MDIPARSGRVVRVGVAVGLLLGFSAMTAAPALADENTSPRYYAADDASDEYGGSGLVWSGPADYGPGSSGDRGDEAFALGGSNALRAEDTDEGNFGTRPFTLRFSARFLGDDDGDADGDGDHDNGDDEQLISKRSACRGGSYLDVRTRDGQVVAELRSSGSRVSVANPADVHDGDWHVVTLTRTGTALSVDVDGEKVTKRAATVADLDNSAPMRFGDGPCVGTETTRPDVLLDDISYGTGTLPVAPPLVPGLGDALDGVLAGPGAILGRAGTGDGSDAGDDSDAGIRTKPEDEPGRTSDSSGHPPTWSGTDDETGDRPDRGRPVLAAGAPDAVPTARRGAAAALDFPVDSGATAGIAAAVLPGAGDATARAAHDGLDWTGVLGPAPPDTAQAPPRPLTYQVVPLPAATAPDAADHGDAAEHADTAGYGDAAAAFAAGLRAPGEVGRGVAAVARSLLLAVSLVVLLAVPVGVVNATAAANAGRIGAAVARLRAPAVVGWAQRLPLAGAVALTAGIGGVVYAVLEPAAGFDMSSLALAVGLALAIVVVTAAQQAPRMIYLDRWWGISGRLHLVPAFLLLGLACVVVSRLCGIEPGLVLGTLLAFRTTKVLRADEEGPAAAISAVSLAAVGLVAWIVRDTVAGPGATGAFLPDTVDVALTAITVAAAGNLVFTMVPLRFLDGGAVFRWSKPLWAVLAATGAFAFVHVLLGGRATVLVVLVGAYLLGVAAFWAWFRFRPTPAPAPAQRERALTG